VHPQFQPILAWWKLAGFQLVFRRRRSSRSLRKRRSVRAWAGHQHGGSP